MSIDMFFRNLGIYSLIKLILIYDLKDCLQRKWQCIATHHTPQDRNVRFGAETLQESNVLC